LLQNDEQVKETKKMISEAVASAKKEAETTEAFLRQKVKDMEALFKQA